MIYYIDWLGHIHDTYFASVARGLLSRGPALSEMHLDARELDPRWFVLCACDDRYI